MSPLSSRWMVVAGAVAALAIGFTGSVAAAQGPGEDPRPAPARPAGEGEGPFQRLIIREATLIDGTGSPPRGPVDIVVQGNRIMEIIAVGVPKVPINTARRPTGATKEIDATGMYVMPGFVDVHVHQGTTQKASESEYYNKLWLMHGITTVRGVPFGTPEFSLSEKARSARNEITAPRYFVYQRPGEGWGKGPVRTGAQGHEWVQWAAAQGIDGVKLGLNMETPEVMAAILDETTKQHMGSVAHLAQTIVEEMNADQATVSSDAGFIYNTPGFSTIEEMELFQEAGFHPLEVIRSATLHAAQTHFKSKGTPIAFGVVGPGLLADLAIVDQNPIENLKVLYATGAMQLNDKTGKVEWVGGMKWTIKDGIVHDAKKLRDDVEKMGNAQRTSAPR